MFLKHKQDQYSRAHTLAERWSMNSLPSLRAIKTIYFWGPRALATLSLIVALFFGVSIFYPEYRSAEAFDPGALAPSISISATDHIEIIPNPVSQVGKGNLTATVTSLYTGYTLSVYFGSANFVDSTTSAIIPAQMSDNITSIAGNSWAYTLSSDPTRLRAPSTSASSPKVIFIGDSSDEPQKTNITIIANTTDSVPGIYHNVAYFTAIPNPANYIVAFLPNLSESVTGMPTPSTYIESIGTSTYKTFSLASVTNSATPTTDLKKFCGWSSDPDADCASAHMPGIGDDTFTLYVNAPTVIFYAIWKDSTEPLELISTMQEMTPEIVHATTVGTSHQLEDVRDHKLYWVTKLADGNIWMTQNLDYDLSDPSLYSLSPDTSDVTSARTIIPQNAPTSHTAPTYYDGGDYYVSGGNGTKTDASSLPANSPYRHYMLGDYYSWSAAVAENDTSSFTSRDTKMESSICPKGWRLPTSSSDGSNNDFISLLDAYGGVDASGQLLSLKPWDDPLYYVHAGFAQYDPERIANIGYSNFIWSNTISRHDIAQGIDIRSGKIQFRKDRYRSERNSIRCIARAVPSNPFDAAFMDADKEKQDGYYKMQDMTAKICAAVPTPTDTTTDTSTQLIDTRDSKLYWVSKLKDGHCWMTQNLDYDIIAGSNEIANLDGTADSWTSSTSTAASPPFNYYGYTDVLSYDPGNKYLPLGDGSPTTISCDVSQNDGSDCHYHLGNFYTWNAATAGTGGTNTATDATASICPTGWRLPTSNVGTVSFSFEKLANAYDIPSSFTSDSTVLRGSPLWFTLDGESNSSYISNQQQIGALWSSRAHNSDTFAYLYKYTLTTSEPTANRARNYGHNVRCVYGNPIGVTLDITGCAGATTYTDDEGNWTTVFSQSCSNVSLTSDVDVDIFILDGGKTGKAVIGGGIGTTSYGGDGGNYKTYRNIPLSSGSHTVTVASAAWNSYFDSYSASDGDHASGGVQWCQCNPDYDVPLLSGTSAGNGTLAFEDDAGIGPSGVVGTSYGGGGGAGDCWEQCSSVSGGRYANYITGGSGGGIGCQRLYSVDEGDYTPSTAGLPNYGGGGGGACVGSWYHYNPNALGGYTNGYSGYINGSSHSGTSGFVAIRNAR